MSEKLWWDVVVGVAGVALLVFLDIKHYLLRR